MLKVSQRALDIPPFFVMEVMRAANEREIAKQAVHHLEVGQPGTSAPEGALRAAENALRAERLGYTDALGIPDIREAVAKRYGDYYGLNVAPERIVATTGSSAGFVLAFLAAFDPGDRVALAAPGYPCYRNILSALGIEPVLLPAELSDRFQPTPALLDKALEAGPLAGLIVASPSNPTGTMLDSKSFQELVAYCGAHDIRLVSDEIYHGITYGADADSALSFTQDAVIINSFSKYFSMTGWRLGWMVMPEDLLRVTESLSQNLYISPPTLSQIAAVAALDCSEELDRNVAQYARNRELLLEELPKAGFDSIAPADGAFYLYADVSHMTNDSDAFCRTILAETGVAITPGIDFDPDRGNRFVRFSFAGTTDTMAAAAKALQDWREG
ncbi:MAG: aminotransferase class I/II-fold pyridoxal phosphate-dependent enzyme [Rhodospirillaceae bacterium]|nr:aminotransferase class I/II-fold pyridoxal phosphate-dependent enzyme [Rhodospirillaceae bacterium]MDD9913642.1 aminotransferase class I/II-fold pyridoxal phosphate-dependent enzyme [Rhodospirillaceae bacterium]MDD9925173.1 aminotransferase class I/II-fold pyridoxal phosphate-dependent enzyme [Rhodospirillaceae bacterium]